MRRQDLEKLSREELIKKADSIGVTRPRALTVVELIDEILSRSVKGESERKQQRGWLGRARDLLASVVERGLHLPGAAKVIRSNEPKPWPAPPPPLPTVTLAEIYAAQGHLERAIGVLDEVLAREPEHAEARALRERFIAQSKGRAKPAAAAEARSHELEPTAEADEESSASSAKPDATSEAEIEPDAAEPEVAASDATELPDRYEVDEIVALAVDPTTVYFYWEILPTTLAAARAASPHGAVVVRIVTVLASWDGPVTRSRDVQVDALAGDRFVADLSPGAQVRVSIGYASGDRFEPFAVGVEVELPRAKPSAVPATEVAAWTPRPSEPQRVARADSALASALGRAREPRSSTFSTSLGDERVDRIVEIAIAERVDGPAVVKTRRLVRVRPLGSSELVREILDETTVEQLGGVRYLGASNLTRGGASNLARIGARDLEKDPRA